MSGILALHQRSEQANRPALLESHSNGRSAAASLFSFHNHDQLGHPDKDVIPLKEVSPTMIARELRSELGQSGALLDDLLEEVLMFGRVDVLLFHS